MRCLLWSVNPLISSLPRPQATCGLTSNVEQGGGFRHIPDNAMVRLACGGAVPQIAPLSLLDFRLAVWSR